MGIDGWSKLICCNWCIEQFCSLFHPHSTGLSHNHEHTRWIRDFALDFGQDQILYNVRRDQCYCGSEESVWWSNEKTEWSIRDSKHRVPYSRCAALYRKCNYHRLIDWHAYTGYCTVFQSSETACVPYRRYTGVRMPSHLRWIYRIQTDSIPFWTSENISTVYSWTFLRAYSVVALDILANRWYWGSSNLPIPGTHLTRKGIRCDDATIVYQSLHHRLVWFWKEQLTLVADELDLNSGLLHFFCLGFICGKLDSIVFIPFSTVQIFFADWKNVWRYDSGWVSHRQVVKKESFWCNTVDDAYDVSTEGNDQWRHKSIACESWNYWRRHVSSLRERVRVRMRHWFVYFSVQTG